MKLQDLLHELQLYEEIETIHINDYRPVRGLKDNSSDIEEDDLFVAIKGYHKDGHSYIDQAIEKGACVVVGEEDVKDIAVPYIQVYNSRKALGILSRKFYDFPFKDKLLIGITGTNGKTTTSYLLKHFLESEGRSCSLFGSIQNLVNGVVYPASNTTPNSLEMNKWLAESEDDVVIMEVSSHALTQYRVEGLLFDYAIFTNLTHDHLDYHSSMEEYFEAKKRLFGMLKKDGTAIINADDFWGGHLSKLLKKQQVPTYTIATNGEGNLNIVDYDMDPPRVVFKEGKTSLPIDFQMYGLHNIYNLAMAFATAKNIGVDTEVMAASITDFEGVKGRFQVFKQKNGVTFVVDYAHTPDAVFHCLKTAKECGAKRIYHVFGFRGDRDPTKRREMISISSEWSDTYILTFDDLNSASPDEMAKALEELQHEYGNEKGVIVTDRTLAIKRALEFASEGDWILITGKGNESYQQTYSTSTTSDEETARYFSYEKSSNQ